MKKMVSVITGCFLSFLCIGQSGNLTLKGNIKNLEGKSIQNVTIQVIDMNTLDTSTFISKSNVKTNLPLNGEYKIIFSHPDYLDKFIICNTEKARSGDYKFKFDMVLGSTEEPKTMFDRPMSVLSYNYGRNEFTYNQLKTKRYRSEYKYVLTSSNP